MVNYNFFTGRPLVGMGLENKITSEQFTNTTSELAKFLGKAGLIAPVNIDHLIKGYLGTTGGLALQATSSAANIGSNVPTPEKSLQDTLASTPGLSTFFIRENGAAMKNDYYELRGEVDKAVATYNNMLKTGRTEDAKEFYQDKKELFAVKQQVNTIERQLTKLRDRTKIIYASTKMSSEEKGAELDRIKQIENRMLANINDLRKRAGFVNVKPKSTFAIKPDLFSLELFRNAMTKQIPSTVALEYVYQIQEFPADIYDSYLEIILMCFHRQYIFLDI
jgi:hypothetical protein